jgi:Icc-related predicted phosphoesterase
LNICAHIHEKEGKIMLSKTLVVKLGPAMYGRVAKIDISDKIEVSFFDL